MQRKEEVKRQEERGAAGKFLDFIEKVGNKLPEPLVLFVWLSGIVLLLSFILSVANVTAVNPVTGDEVTVVNLLSKSGIQRMITGAVGNFLGFPALGLVMVIMLGVGLAERSGLFSTLLRSSLSNVKKDRVIMATIFIGIMSNVAGDSGPVLLPPLAAMIFMTVGMNPIVGIMAVYAGVMGGFGANLVIELVDVVLASFTQSSAQMIDAGYSVFPTANWYFIIISTFLLVVAGTWVTKRYVAPRMGTLDVGEGHHHADNEVITAEESRAAKKALISVLLYVILIAAISIPQNALLRSPESGALLEWGAPFMDGMIPLLALFFFIPGVVYGKSAGTIKNASDIYRMLTESIADLASYVVLVFVISQFFFWFMWSNIGMLVAMTGANILSGLGLPIPVVLVLIVLMCAIINLFIGGASSKWGLLAPIFVPMLMLLDVSPEMTQMAYRIGDSVTNMITPLNPYFAIVLGMAKKYDKNLKIGTFISNMMPYSIGFLVIWIIQLLFWYFFKLPLGPGAGISL
ncbi:aminobenzoyl-glutamate transport protein [Dethiosulfatibacter aminovorans DSM 17477]|uniref:Aminobenzoyl-glutamate transport protein n=1 Tax=Dethiosulfatibacter aminovorans DSM 17477 TaxID=1121476 RepID=A0A1M6N6E0_9FIRM|nr:AbgT family transporter [Dethiosulfatibacter aminovorans]SHJ91267.1 aminobenzoyl-glutamate transport protein [Dethiosulfatibacter aminovorans DSM 17477]